MAAVKRLRAAFGLVLLLTGPTAFAVPMLGSDSLASVEGTALTDTSSSATTSFASTSVADPSGSSEYQTSGAVDAAGNIGVSASFFGTSGTKIGLGSRSAWKETFEFAAGDNATFEFFIPSAVLAFEANNVSGLSGNFGVTIRLNSTTIFSTFAQVSTLTGTPQSPADLALRQGGTTPFTATFETGLAPGFGLGGAGYRFDSFSGSLNLNPIVGSNQVVYILDAFARGLIDETSAIASIGDPLNLAVGPSATLTVTPGTPDAVAEPNPLVMLAMGLFAVCAARRQRP